MNTELKNIIVLGAGESGTGAAVLAACKGHHVFVSDKGTIKEDHKELLRKYKIEFEEGKHSESRILEADEIIKSPGIPDHIALIQKITAHHIPIIDELEFAARYTTAKKICITGSNGKTTTTMLTHFLFQNAGLNVGLAGNVGKSFALQVATENYDIYILEISSFQLDHMYNFKADIAIITNITPDHLDRYDHSFEKYTASKFRILQNQTANDAFIYCADDEATLNGLKLFKPKAKQYPFSIKRKIEGEGAYLNEKELIINIHQNPMTMNIERLALQGKHNVYNSMAAGISGRIQGIRKSVIRKSFAEFESIPHRLEYVAKVHGIEFINDSKATNVNSTWYALESMTKPVIWIAGGLDKGNDYTSLKALVRERVKAIICLGVDNSKIIEEFQGLVPTIVEARSAKEAVEKAYYLAEEENVVLLSPACASFDLFENFEDRGRQFKEAINEL